MPSREDAIMLAIEKVCDGRQHSRMELRAVARELEMVVRRIALDEIVSYNKARENKAREK